MKRDEVIKMAVEAGFKKAAHDIGPEPSLHAESIRSLYRLAELVAAAEREECAKVAEKTVCDTHLPTGIKIYGTNAARAIRARKGGA